MIRCELVPHRRGAFDQCRYAADLNSVCPRCVRASSVIMKGTPAGFLVYLVGAKPGCKVWHIECALAATGTDVEEFLR